MQDRTNKNRAIRRKLEPRKILHFLQSEFSATLMVHFNDSYRNFSIFVASLQKGNKVGSLLSARAVFMHSYTNATLSAPTI